MNVWKPIAIVSVAGLVAMAGLQVAQAGNHPNLDDANNALSNAAGWVDKAQAANGDKLGGHGQKAKAAITTAQAEVNAAMTYLDAHGH